MPSICELPQDSAPGKFDGLFTAARVPKDVIKTKVV